MADQNVGQQQTGNGFAGGIGGNFNSNYVPRGGFGGRIGDGSVAQGYQPQNQRNDFQQQYFQGEGSGTSSNNLGQNFDNQQQFNGPVFGGEFGNFDEGYYDSGNVQNQNQNQGNFNPNNNQRFRRPYKQQTYNGRGRASGRFNIRGSFNGRGPRLNNEQQDVPQSGQVVSNNPNGIVAATNASAIGVTQGVGNKDIKLKNDSDKVGRVRITGGQMSTQQLLMKLEWLVPGQHQWDITPVGIDSFRVVFPSKADLVRQRRLKPVDVEGTSIIMHFEDWTSRILDKWGLFDMWIRVFGCPDTLCRDFLGLFAVGSLVSKTKEVDMKYAREHEIACMRIDCANPQLIPRYLDHFFDGEGFGIEIHVEALDGSVVPAGFADQDEDNDDSDSKKDGDGIHEADNSDKGKPPSAVVPADKAVEEQQKEQTGSEEMVEAVDHVQVVIDHFACPSASPLNRGSKSVPSKRCIAPHSTRERWVEFGFFASFANEDAIC
ncbi:hypothetical protein ACQ4PT_040577 [Festuca glaucescens]